MIAKPTGSWRPRPRRPRSWSGCTGPTPSTSGSCRRASTTRCSCPRDRAPARERLASVRAPARAVRGPAAGRTRGPTSRCARWPRRSPATRECAGDLVLAIVGGPSGADHGAEVTRLMELASRPRRARSRDAVPAAAAGQARRLLRRRRRRARALAVASRSDSSRWRRRPAATPVVAAEVGGSALRRRGRADRLPRGGSRSRRPCRPPPAVAPRSRARRHGWAPRPPGRHSGSRGMPPTRRSGRSTTSCSTPVAVGPAPLLTCGVHRGVIVVTSPVELSLFPAGL